jgi:hypothetical protein
MKQGQFQLTKGVELFILISGLAVRFHASDLFTFKLVLTYAQISNTAGQSIYHNSTGKHDPDD